MDSTQKILDPVRAWMPETPGDWLWFCRQQALACVFPWSILGFLALTRHFPPPCVPRYDAILIFCLIVQYALYRAGWESEREVKVIASFHVLGLMLELHKTSLGCWSYPEPSWLRIGRVPLYSGFMYASVASYCCQAWRRLELTVEGWPASWKPVLLASAIYANFFTERLIGDWRGVLIPLVFLTFARTSVRYRLRTRSRAMPLAASLTGIGAAIWIAENISTRCGAWRYPYQQHAWRFVDTGKLSSWFLLVVVTFLIVAQLKRIPKRSTGRARTQRAAGIIRPPSKRSCTQLDRSRPIGAARAEFCVRGSATHAGSDVRPPEGRGRRGADTAGSARPDGTAGDSGAAEPRAASGAPA